MKYFLCAILFSFSLAAVSEDHDHDHEVSEQVGPDKGITAADEHEGIKLSSEAEKNFEIKKIKVSDRKAVEIPKSAVVTAGTEVNLYRVREGFFKRVDFDVIRKNSASLIVKSADLKAGDEVVTAGVQFVRFAELAAFGGEIEGHSH